MTRPAYIVAARRTAIVPRGGAFARLGIEDLAAPVLRACLADAGMEGAQVDEVILANALGGGGNPARLAALKAGLPERVAGLTIDRQCCGGLDAIALAGRLVAAGAAEAVLAGGAESYSRRPLRLRTDPEGGPPVPYDRPPFAPWPERDPDPHAAAAVLAERLGISRAEQEAWAMESHRKALAAKERLAEEIVVIPEAPLETDPFARKLSEKLCARSPSLAGSVSAATAAPAADAAAFVLVASERFAQAPLARIAAAATVGGPPELPGLAPVAAIKSALAGAGLRPEALDRVELMEAYAVQAIACAQETGLDPARINPAGGALARGHPIGASGAVLAVGLAWEGGVAAIAAMGGIGAAMVLEKG